MCGRFSLSASAEELSEIFGLEDPPPVAVPRYNIAPSQPVLAVREASRGRRQAALLRWGLEVPESPLLINARAETAATRAPFREAFRRRRCLVPADGFYEWRKGRGGSQPFHVRRRDGRVLALAALWEPGPGEGSCVILTTEPNELVAPIHDRMPVIVGPERFAAWLGAPAEEAGALLRPYPSDELEAVPVSAAVNNTQNDGPECLAPPPAGGPRQGLLFPEIDEP